MTGERAYGFLKKGRAFDGVAPSRFRTLASRAAFDVHPTQAAIESEMERIRTHRILARVLKTCLPERAVDQP